MAEVLGGISATASLTQQSFQLLDRIQMALDHRKNFSMHLTTVMRDVEGAKSILQRILETPLIQTDDLTTYLSEFLRISNEICVLVDGQEAMTQKDRGFRLFVHDFVKGPAEQKRLEELRTSLVASKNTLTLAIVAGLAPAGTTLSVTNTKLSGTAYQQNGRIIREKGDKDFDNIIVRNVVQGGASLMMNSALTPDQVDKLTREHKERASFQFQLEQYTGLLKDPNVEPEIKKGILNIMTKPTSNGV